MKQSISKFFKQLSGVIVSFVCVGFVHGGPGLAAGYIDFANRSSNIALTSTSVLRLKDPAKVIGWGQGSITRQIGDNAATLWVPAYGADVVLTGTNTTLPLVVNNSNAIILNVQRITNNSNAIIKNTQDITNNSNTILVGFNFIVNNSNAIVKNTQDITNNSNAIVSMGDEVELVRTTSNALLFCCKNTSNTLLYLNNNNSNAIVKNTQDITNNSNAIILGLNFIVNNSNAIVKNTYDIKNNSNAIVKNTEDIRVNSNAFLFCCKNTSNALLFLTKNNSNAIVWLDTQMHTIDHGPLDHEVVTTTTHMIFDIYLSHEHHMNVHTSTVIDGHGHVINFAKDQINVFNVDAGCNVTLTNVILRGYEDDAVSLDTGASVIFGDGTRIELQETPVQLERDWTFEGDARVEGLATQLVVEPYNIVVSPNSSLVLGDIDLVGLKQNNMRCGGDTSLILLRNIAMHMTHDYSFTSGTLQFEQDVVMTGTGTFTLGTNMVSTILENSSLIVDGPTFSYDPSIVDRDLLAMTDETSRLILLGSILDSSTAGLRLTKGTLKVDHINYITNTGALLPNEGISLGNGTVADDLHIEMLPGGSLEVLDGILTYENVN